MKPIWQSDRTVVSMCFTPDGTRLLTGGDLGDLTLWDVATGEILVEKTRGSNSIAVAAAGPDRFLAGTKSILLLDGETLGPALGGPTFKGHRAPPNTIALSPDGQTVASGGGSFVYSDDCFLFLWRYGTAELIAKASLAKKRGVLDVAWAPGGELLATANEDGAVRLVEPADGRVCWSTELSQELPVDRVRFSPDGDQLYASIAEEGRLFRIDLGRRSVKPCDAVMQDIDEARPREMVFCRAFAALSDQRVVVARVVAYEDGYDHRIFVVNSATDSVDAQAELPPIHVDYLELSPDGVHYVIAGTEGLYCCRR